jgi:PAS domain S-box-containing protein
VVAADAFPVTDLLETLPDAIVAVDRDGNIVQANSQTQEIFGYEREALIGQKIEMLVPDRYRGQHRHHRQAFAEAPKTRRMGTGLDLYGRRRDGSEFPVEISLSPIVTDKGTFVLSAIRDITDRKRIEEELRSANEELYRRTAEQLGDYRSRLVAIIDSSEDAIIGKGLDGTITSWNKGAERIYGYSPEEVVGKNIAILAPADRPDEIPEILRKIARGERVEHREAVRISKGRRRLDVSISVSPLRDSSGEIAGASSIARDITAQKRTEAQLRQSQKMEAVGLLAAGLAHDFNNILGIVNACMEFLRDRIDPKVEHSVYLENIRDAINQGKALTKQLLTFSRSTLVQPQIFDLHVQLRGISKLLRPLLGVDIEISILSRSPETIVEADPIQLDQVVVNLAMNARDAMPEGGKLILETGLIEFDDAFGDRHQTLPRGKYVLLAVSDTGVGMDEATLSRIFEPFFTTKEVGKGTGLGLATVYGIVKQIGGHIFVYSEPGNGTTFKIYLPSADHQLGQASEPRVEAVIPELQGNTILLVEDDDIMRGLTRQLLREHGYKVVEANDGKAALELVKSNSTQIDLLLTDVVMRRMGGPELAGLLGTSLPALKVIYMSGYTGEMMANREILKREVTLIEKPFTRTDLLNAIHAALGGVETRRDRPK